MPKTAPLQSAFNGGELSPFLAGRSDVAKYAAGCEVMEGWLPLVEGPAITRPGTVYVAETKDSADRSWTMRFEKAADDSYMIEVGDQYLRFYTNHGQVQVSGVAAWVTTTAYTVGDLVSNGGTNYYCRTAHTSGTFATDLAASKWYALTGTIFEIPAPWSVADLTDSGGAFALRYVQTGDVVYIVHPDYAPRKLSRYSGTRWTLEEATFSPPPFATENDTATTVYASASTGTVTLTASSSIFTSDKVGQYIKLTEKDVRDVEQWEAAKSINAGDLRRSDGKNYEALNSATTGSVKPTHSRGAAFDGDGGVQWQYNDAGSGYAKITAVGGTTATATVVSQIPDGATLVANATTRWAFQAWNDTDGYPTCATFFRERLVFARDETVWFSVAGAFDDFSTEVDGQVTIDAGFERTIASDRVNSIRWLSPGDVLLVGTLGDEWAITESTLTEPFGPNNCKTKRQSTYGSNTVAPQRIGSETVFVQRSGKKLRGMAFKFEEDGFQSPNLCAFHRTVTKTGIIDIAYQQEPWSVLWCVRSDGVLAALTLDREQDVLAWSRHPFSGGIVESVECIPAPDGGQDDLWLQVKYTIAGTTKRYLAYMAQPDDEDTDQTDWVYSDMCATYDGAAATTISGLDYLEGKAVWVLADGARHPNRTVTSGEITLQQAASKVQVGLASPATLTTMDVEGGNPIGTSQGKVKRAHFMTIRTYRMLGGRAGPDADTTEEMRYRQTSVPLGSPPAPYTGDVEMEWDHDYSTHMKVTVIKDRPMPITLISVMPQLQVEPGR